MTTIVLRSDTPAGLTNAQLDANFRNLNNDKVEVSYLNSLLSAGSVESTAVMRDTAGDISAHAYKSTIANTTTISGALAYRVGPTDTNNTVQYCSDKAAIRTFLGLGSTSTITAQAYKATAADTATISGALAYRAGTNDTNNTVQYCSDKAAIRTFLELDDVGTTINITDDNTTNATRYITWEDSTSGESTGIGVSSNKLWFNPGTGTLAATAFNALSDASLKDSVTDLTNARGVLQQIRGVGFKWTDTGAQSYGVIAQEIERVLPAVVETADNGIKSVNYAALTGFLIAAVNELSAEIERLKHK